MNVVILAGRLTADPELRQTQNGVSVTNFCIAVDRRYDRETTDFINIVAWRNAAEFVCKYFRKGDGIEVEGSIQTRPYTDMEGNKRTAFEVVASQLHFPLSNSKAGKPGNGQAGNPSSGNSYSSYDIDPGDYEELESEEDMPF